MKTNEKRLADRLVWRMAALLRVLKTKNDRLIAAAAKLVHNHARIGPFGLLLSKGDIRRLEKTLAVQPAQFLEAAQALKSEGRHEAGLVVARVYELFASDYAGIYSAQFAVSDEARGLGMVDADRHYKNLEQISRDRRRTPDARRRAMLVLLELGQLERAVRLAMEQLDGALKSGARDAASDLMLLIGEFGCYWSPEEDQRRWAQRDRDVDEDSLYRDLNRRRREQWML